MSNLKNKLQFEGTDMEFIKSILKLQILSDLLSKELNANYPKLNPNYKKELKGIERTFEAFKSQVNSNVNWCYNNLTDGQKIALFTLSEEIEKIIKDVTNEIYE